MSLGAAIFSYLSGAGLAVGNRVYPLALPQGAVLPAHTYQLVSDVPELTHDVQQDHPLYDGLRNEESRVQFSSYGTTFDEAEAVSDELKAVITGYRGQWGSVQIESVEPVNALDDYDPATGMWRRISDFFIKWIGGSDGGS